MDDFWNNFYGVLMGHDRSLKIHFWTSFDGGVLKFNCRFRTFDEVFNKMEVRFGFLGLIRVDWYA